LEKCKICSQETKLIFKRQVLRKFLVSYFQCENCGFTQTEKPFWLSESYDESMNLGDVGQMVRCISNLIKVKNLLRYNFNSAGVYLDFAGGYGMFTRAMRDFGFNFFWDDLYTPNLIAKGFEKGDKLRFEAVTVFECFEHFENPIDEIHKLLKYSDTIIFTTGLITEPAPKEWWYYGFDHGQHISLFTKNSLEYLAKKLGCSFYSRFGIHILSNRKLSPVRFWYSMFLSKIELKIIGMVNKNSLTSQDHFKLVEEKK